MIWLLILAVTQALKWHFERDLHRNNALLAQLFKEELGELTLEFEQQESGLACLTAPPDASAPDEDWKEWLLQQAQNSALSAKTSFLLSQLGREGAIQAAKVFCAHIYANGGHRDSVSPEDSQLIRFESCRMAGPSPSGADFEMMPASKQTSSELESESVGFHGWSSEAAWPCTADAEHATHASRAEPAAVLFESCEWNGEPTQTQTRDRAEASPSGVVCDMRSELESESVGFDGWSSEAVWPCTTDSEPTTHAPRPLLVAQESEVLPLDPTPSESTGDVEAALFESCRESASGESDLE